MKMKKITKEEALEIIEKEWGLGKWGRLYEEIEPEENIRNSLKRKTRENKKFPYRKGRK